MTTAVLFDMDGVLVDSEPIINAAAIRALAEFGVTARPEDFEPFVGAGEDRYVGGVAELHGRKYIPEMKRRTYEWYLKLLPEMGKAFPGAGTWCSTCTGWASLARWLPAPTGSRSRPTW